MRRRTTRPAGGEAAARSLSVTALAALLLLAPAAAAAEPLSASGPAGAGPEASRTDGPAPELTHGREAVDALGSELPSVAHEHGLTPARLEAILEQDSTLSVDGDGKLLYVERTPALPRTPAPVAEAAEDYSQTFRLHSRPGADRVIYLDFDGEVVSNTAWNQSGVTTAAQPPFDSDGSPGTFSTGEQDVIQSVWRLVSEDFAPFGIDVTTERPADDRITRSGSGDTTFGTRVLITPGAQAHSAICQSSCGGVAYLSVFDAPSSHSYYQPAWVFSHAMHNNAKYIAEATSHEVGHNLGLQHDGTSTAGYYAGHGAWAPIMGVGYSAPVSQWSAGTYAGANNRQDDMAVMAAHGAAPLTDDHADVAAGATALAAGAEATGLVSRASDKDLFATTRSCTGPLTVTARPAEHGPNLDIRLRLLSADGTQLASADPVSAKVSYDTASGLGASLTADVPAGSYTVEVDGVGALDPLRTGYDDFGSVGRYTVSVNECGGTSNLPGAPTGIGATAVSATAARVSFTPPTSAGGSAISGYTSTCTSSTGGALRSATGATSPLTVSGLTTGQTYTCAVRASNAFGAGAPSSASESFVAKAPPTAPGVPTSVKAVATSATDASVSFAAPRSTGGSPITGYEATCTSPDGASASTTGATSPLLVSGLTTGHSYRCSVRAVNAAGTGLPSVASAAFLAKAPPVAPDAPTAVVATPTSATVARVGFLPPASDGGKPVKNYTAVCTSTDGGTTRSASGSRSPLTMRSLTAGTTYTCTVAARNSVGLGAASLASDSFVAKAPPTAPNAATSVTVAVVSATQARVSFTAPLSDGGSSISGYEVACTSTNGGVAASQTGEAGPLVVDGLTTGASYRCRVRAVNAIGLSAWSTSSASFVVRV